MWFKINRDVPANTAITSEDWQKLLITKGTLKQWVVTMPEECADLMQFRVEYHGTQIFPFTRNEYIGQIFEPLRFPEDIKINIPPFVLDVYAYNLDTRESHEYNLYVYVESEKSVTIPTSSFNLREAWSNLFGGGE